MWSLLAWANKRPSLTSSIKERPACFCSEVCHSWEHSSMTSSITELDCRRADKPEVMSSWPCEPTIILDKSCENSTNMSLRKGAMLYKAFSSFSVMLTLAALRSISACWPLCGYSGSFCWTGEGGTVGILLAAPLEIVFMLASIWFCSCSSCFCCWVSWSLSAISLNSAPDLPLACLCMFGLSALSSFWLSSWFPFSLFRSPFVGFKSSVVCFFERKKKRFFSMSK